MADNNPIIGNTKVAEAPRLTNLSGRLAQFDMSPIQVGDIYQESQYTPKVLVQELPDLENRRAELQPWEDKLGNGLVNMTTSAFTGALESTVGLVYGAGAAMFSEDASKFYDNAFGRSMDAINNSVRESNPFYYSEAEKNASLLGGMGYQNFWFDKVLGGAGYTIGSMLAGYGMGKLFQMGKAAQLAQMTDEVSAAAKAGQLSQEALKYSRWDMGKQIALGGIMAHGESSMEARQTYDATVENYTRLRTLANDPNADPETKRQLAAYANLTDEKIDQLGRSASDTNYLVNMAVTGPTDMILLGKFINPGKKAAIKTYNEIGKREVVGGTVEYFDKVATKKARALLDTGSKFLKGFVTEGTQEGAQFASNIAAQEFAELHGIQKNDWFDSVTTAMAEGLTETFTTKEGLESVLVGGLVGGPFGLKGAGAERKAQDARTKQLVDALNADPEFTQANPKVNAFLGALNAANKSEDFLANGDLFNAKNASDQALNHYIKKQIDLGTADYFVEKLQGMKEMEQEERDKHFGPGTTPEQIDQVINKVQKLSELNDSIETLYGTPGGTPEQKAYNQRLRENLFFAASTIKDVEGRIGSIESELTGMQDPEVQQLLALRENVKNVAKDTKVTELSDEAKALIKNETDRLSAQIASENKAGVDSSETERKLNLIKVDPEKYFNRRLEEKKQKASQYDAASMPGSLEMKDVEQASKELDTIINKKSFLKPFEVPEGKTREDYARDMRDAAIETYNQAVKNYVTNNPVEGNMVSEMLADLNALDNRKYDFVEYYNELNDPELAAKRLTQVQAFINEMQKQTQEEDNEKKESDALAKLNLESLDKLVKPNTRRETNITFNNNEIDITKMSNEDLQELLSNMNVEANDLFIDGLTDEAAAVRKTAETVKEELDFRQNAQQVIDQAREALAKATTPEEVDAIVKALNDTGYFTIDETEVAQLKHNVTRKATIDNNIQQNIQRKINVNFRGIDEFYLSFTDNNAKMKEDYDAAIARPDAEKRIYFKIKPNVDQAGNSQGRKLSRIGNNDKLQKVSPPIVIEIWSKGDENSPDLHIGYMPWYGQYADANGIPLNIQDLTGTNDFKKNEEAYNALFEPDHSQGARGYREFKDAHSKMEQLYKQLETIFNNPANQGKEVELSPAKTAQLAGVEITKGMYNIDTKETPLSEYKEEGTATPPLVLNGTPVIISVSTFDGSSNVFYQKRSTDASKPNPITVDTRVASVLDSNGNPVLQDSSTVQMGTRSEFLPALEALRDRLSAPKVGETIYNKYWMLVEDPQGSITIEGYEGKKFDWRPLTSRQLNVNETDTLLAKVRQLRQMLLGMDPQSTEQNTQKNAFVKELNNSFFTALSSFDAVKELKNISMGFTGNPESGLAVKIDFNTFGYDIRDQLVNEDGTVTTLRSSQGQVFLQVPESALESMVTFTAWFNNELQKPQQARWKTSANNQSRTAINLANKIAPISNENFRLNFIGQSVDSRQENIKGISSITPDNVYDSFATRVSRELPRVNRRLKVTPTASAVTSVPAPNPQPAPAPAPAAGPITVTPPPILPAGITMGETGEVDPITAAFGPLATLPTPAAPAPVAPTDKKAEIEKRKQKAESKITIIDIDVVDKSGNKTGEVRIKEYATVYGEKRLAAKTEEKLKKLIEAEYDAELAAIGTAPAPSIPTNKKAEIEKINDAFNPKDNFKSPVDEWGIYIENDKNELIKPEIYVTIKGNNYTKEELLDIEDPENPAVQETLNEIDRLQKLFDAELAALGAPTQSRTTRNRNLSAEEIAQRTGKKPGPVRSVGELRNMKLSGQERIKMEDAAARLAKILPSWISVQEMAPLLENWRQGRVTFGSFFNNIIKLSRLAPAGTELHEAFHAVFRTLLTDAQQDALYKEAKDMMIRDLKKKGKSFIQGFAQFKKDRPDYTEMEDMTEEQLKNLYIEEWMADEFARQSKTALAKKQQAPKGALASLWEQFVDLLNRMVRFFTGQKQLTRLFNDIEAGRFKAAEKPVVNRFSKNPELNVEARSEIFIGYEQKPDGSVQALFLDPTYEQKFVNTIASTVLAKIESLPSTDTESTPSGIIDEQIEMFGQMFNPNNNPDIDYDNPDPSVKDRIDLLLDFDFLFNGMTEEAIASRNKLKNEILLKLKEFNVDEFDVFANEDYDGSNDITERNFDLNNENKGGFTSLPKALRKYISTTTYTTTIDEFLGLEPGTLFGDQTITTTVDPQKVYSGIVKMAANQADPRSIIRKMQFYARTESESSFFIKKFFEDAGITFDDNGDFTYNPSKKKSVQRVIKAFNLFEIDYMFTAIDNKNLTSKTYSANRRNVDKVQVDLWAATYSQLKLRKGAEELKRLASELNFGIITRNITEKVMAVDGKTQEVARPMTDPEIDKIVSTFKSKLKGIGISLSEQYLRYIMLSGNNKLRTPDQERFVLEFQSSVKLSAEKVEESMKFIVNLVAEGSNPFVRSSKLKTGEEGAVTRLMAIAKDNAVFDETVVMQTMVNAEGKNIYPYQKASYHIQKIYELQNLDLTDPDVLEQIQSEKPNSDFLVGNRLLNNEVFRQLLPNLKITRIDGMRLMQLDENLKGKLDAKNAEGVTYGKMSPRELALSMYTMFADNSTDAMVPVATPEGKTAYVKTSARRFLFNVLEASNTADTVVLPVSNYIDKNGRITQEFKDAYFAEIKREYDRIQKVRNGEYADKYNKFNAFTEKEEDQRGRKFWETKNFLESIDPTGDLKTRLEQGELTLEEVTPLIMEEMDKYFLKELRENIEKLKELGILKDDGTNRLLPKVYQGGVADDPLFNSSLLNNISNVYLNDFLNSISLNQILMGDPALSLKDNLDWFKRAKGNNASGDNMLGIDPNQNATPIRMVTIGALNNKGELDDFYNEEYKLSTRIYKIGSPEYENYRQGLSEEERRDFDAKKPKQIAIADAQAYTTVKGMMGFLDSLGRLDDKTRAIYEKIAEGKRIDAGEWSLLKKNGVMLNSQKLVYYDGVTYVKMSVAVLSPEYTSDSNGNARPGMEFLHNMRKDMETKNIEMVGPPSMMKKMIKNPYIVDPANPSFDMEESNVQSLDRGYLRLQQENPSNKTEIKDPTQQQNIITAEQTSSNLEFPWDSKVKTGLDLVGYYDKRLAERIKTAFIPAKNFLLKLKNNEWDINMKRAVKAFKKTLETTGASQQILAYLEVDENGNPIYNLNSPNIVKEFEQHFNAFFNNVLSQKVPGYKTTLQSGFMHRVLEDTQTGKIISTVEYDADPSKYADRNRYKPRRLAFDQPRIVNGKEVHRYSEVVIPFHFAEQFNLKPGDQIPEEIAYLFGTRIPSQDKHSAMVLKIVDVLPPHAGSNMIAPDELIILTGSDFDVDSFFIQRPDHYFKNDRFMIYGNNEDSKWEQFKTWHKDNNKLVKDLMEEMELEAMNGNRYSSVLKQALLLVRQTRQANERVSELGMIGEGYEALTEREKELVSQTVEAKNQYKRAKEIIKELEQSNFIKALKELGLPSTEKEFNEMGIRSMGEINNEILNARMVLHSNPSMNDINKTPATLDPIEESLNQLASDFGYMNWKEMSTKYSPNSILGKLESFETNKAGQSAIGASVNNTNNYSIISRFGIQIKENEKNPVPKVEINGQEVDGISNDVFMTKDGKRIMDVNSSLTSSMTDNTKYGYNSKLNLDIQTLSVVSLLTMNKVKIYDAIRFINSQYVVKYGKETTQYAVQTETEESRKKEVGNDLLNELLTRAKNANGGTRTDTEIQMEGKGPVTNEDLVIVTRLNPRSKALVNKTNAERRAFYDNLDPQERYAYYMAELRILNAYLTLSKKHTPELIAFSQIVKLTKGIASSTKETSFKGDEDLRNYLETLNLKLVHTVDGWRVEYGDAKPEDLPLYDFKDILNRHLISLENLKVFADKTEAQKNYFISQTKFAETLRKKLNRGLKKRMKNKVRTKAMTQIRRDMESFLMITAWRNSLPENERENLNNYLFTDIAEKNGVLSLVALKEDLMARYPHLEKNLVLQQNIINFKNDQEGLLSKLEANTRSKGNKGFEGMLLTAMRVLANNEGYPLVNAMIKHLIAKNGLQFKNDSPIGLFSPGIYGNEFPFSTLMDEYTSVLNSGNEEDFVRVFGKTPNKLIEEFQELFMLDVNNRDFITKLPEKLLDTAAPEKLVSPVTVTSTGFTIDFDKGVLNKINEALYDDVTGQLVETLDTTDSDRKQRGYNLKKLEAFQFEKKNQQLKRRDKKVAVFDFPKFIQIGKDKYKLKEYVLADNRYEKDEKRFSTEPDSDGNYLGTAATYEKVPTLGYWGVSVIGRTLEEANERTFDDMLALVKKAKGGEQAAMEAADELDMVDDLFDYAAPVSNIPSTPVQVIPQLFTQGTSTRKTYSGKITSLQPNQIFVFGSNEGSSKGAAPTHGAGAAKLAKDKFGAIQGQSRGIQGQSYAIVTKKFYDIEKSSTPQEIITEIKSLYEYAKQNPNKEFLVSDYSESNLNGYTGQEMADMFNLASPIPSNIVFNENFDKLIQSSAQPVETPMSKQDQLVQKNMQGLTGATVTAGAADTASKDLLIFSLTSKGFKTVSDLFYKMYTESFKKNGAPIPAIFAKLQQMGIFAQKDEVNPAFNDAVRKVVMEASPEEVNEMNQKLC